MLTWFISVAIFVGCVKATENVDRGIGNSEPSKNTEKEYHVRARIFPDTEQPERTWPVEEESQEFWRTKTRAQIIRALNKKPIVKKAKNVILFLGDGMGMPSVTAGRILAGQKFHGLAGEEYVTHMEDLDWAGFVKTYNVDFQTPDSAGTATAYLSGIKGRYYTTGLDAGAVLGDCASAAGHEVETVFEKAKKAGKEVGFVTTTYVNHASPSGLYAKTPYRFWYNDARMYENGTLPEDRKACDDIAKQLFKRSPDMSVIMGGGKRHLTPENDPNEPNGPGERLDGRNFIEEWQKLTDTRVVQTADEMFKYVEDGMPEDKLIGIYADDHLEFEVDRTQNDLGKTQPHLANMTEVAIKRMEKAKDGYYLFIEGGRIDQGHHDSAPIRALNDYAAFDEAIGKALSMVDLEETLVIVTADHSHVFSFGANGERGANLFGQGIGHEGWDGDEAFILAYGNGPGFRIKQNATDECDREPPSDSKEKWSNPDENSDFAYPSAAFTASESHGGEDVPVFAQGPMAHLVSGVNEQTFVADICEFALCIGNYADEDHCKETEDDTEDAALKMEPSLMIALMTALILFLC